MPPAMAPVERSAELALLSDPHTIDSADSPVDFVINACQRATLLLREAVDRGDVDFTAELRSAASAYDQYVRQQKMSKDAQLSAGELLRRAERGLVATLNAAQDRGEMYRRHDVSSTERRKATGNRYGSTPVDPTEPTKKTVAEMLPESKKQLHNIRGVSRGTDEQFDEAIEQAHDEGNMSRANVTRLLTGKENRSQRGVLARTRHLRADRIIDQSVIAVEGAAESLNLIAEGDVSDLNPADLAEWASRMGGALRKVRKLEGWLRKYAHEESTG